MSIHKRKRFKKEELLFDSMGMAINLKYRIRKRLHLPVENSLHFKMYKGLVPANGH